LPKCDSMLRKMDDIGELNPVAVLNSVEKMAAKGLRVLAFATKEMPDETKKIRHEDVSSGLIFLGLMGMIDPPRSEAITAVKACQEAGIRISR
jgi:cation-transporting P-type ATPase F